MWQAITIELKVILFCSLSIWFTLKLTEKAPLGPLGKLPCKKVQKVSWKLYLKFSVIWFSTVIISVFCSTTSILCLFSSVYFILQSGEDSTPRGTFPAMEPAQAAAAWLFRGLFGCPLLMADYQVWPPSDESHSQSHMEALPTLECWQWPGWSHN